MKKMILFAFAAATAVLTAGAAEAATTYYVDQKSTSGTEDGTEANPFKTLANAFDGTPVLAPGDTVKVGSGTYALTGGITIPAGVTLKGSYAGFNDAGHAWTTQSVTATPTLVTYSGGTMFSLQTSAVLNGVKAQAYTTGSYNFSLNGPGAKIQNSNIEFRGYGFNANANGVTIETSVIRRIETYDGYAVNVDSSSDHLTLQDNVITIEYNNYNAFYIQHGRFIARRNEVRVLGGYNWVAYLGGHSHVYQNLFVDETGYFNVNLFDTNDDYYIQIERNNISGFYTVLDADSYAEYWGWSFPHFFRNNYVFNAVPDVWGYIEHNEYPVSASYIQNNCLENSVFYVYTYQGATAFPKTVAELQELLGPKVSGNIGHNSAPANERALGCGGFGLTTTPMVTKPIAHGHAYDSTFTGETYEFDTAVGLGVEFTLDGDYKSWNGPGSINLEPGSLIYEWKLHSGPAAIGIYDQSNAYDAEVTTAAKVPGKYVFSLRVKSDSPESSGQWSEPSYVTVYVGQKLTLLSAAGVVRGTYNKLQPAIDAAQPGDIIQFPAGIWRQGDDSDLDTGEIYAKNGLTIQGTGAGANGTVFYMDCSYDAFDVEYSRNITIRNMAFVDACDNGYNAIYGYTVAKLVIDNIAMSNENRDPWYGYGIDIEYGIDVVIQNSRFDYIQNAIITEEGSFRIANNTINYPYGTAIEMDDFDDGYATFTIENNTINAGFFNNETLVELDYMDDQGPFIFRNNRLRNYYYNAVYVTDSDEGNPVQISGNTIANDGRFVWHYGYGIEVYNSSAFIENNIIFGSGYSNIYVGYSNYEGEYEVGVSGNVIAYANDYYYGIENYQFDCPNGNTSGNCRPTTWAQSNLLWANSAGNYKSVDIRDGNLIADPKFTNPNAGDFSLQVNSPLHNTGIGIQGAGKVAAPTGLQGEALPGAVRVTFNAVSGASGYTVYWGAANGVYEQSADLGNELVGLVGGLAAQPYYFAVAAKNGNLSAPIVVTPQNASEQSQPGVFGIEPTVIARGSKAELTITGNGFAEGAKVYAGSVSMATVTVVDENTITVHLGDVPAGIYPVVVVNPDLGRGALPQALTVRTAGSDDSAGCSVAGSGKVDGGWVAVLAVIGYAFWRRRRA